MRQAHPRDPCWDVLRGAAVLGILPVNIWVFGWPLGALDQPELGLRSNPLDHLAWWVVAVLLEHKMVLILAALMGLGLAIMATRPSATIVVKKRLITLAAIGLAHGYLLWWGDILWMLAIAGGLTWWSRRLPNQQLAIVGLCCLIVPSLVMLLWGLLAPSSFSHAFAPLDVTHLEQSLSAYQGNIWTQFQQRWPLALAMQTIGLITFGLWAVLGAMLLGFAGFRSGALSPTQAWLHRRNTGLLLLVAGTLTVLGHRSGLATGTPAIIQPIAGALLSAAYVLLFVQAWASLKPQWTVRLNQILGAVGRLSLSVYLLQSLVLSVLFYGHGLRLMGQLSLSQLLGTAGVLMLLLSVLAMLWERYLGAGPAERLWRQLSYP